MSHKVYVCDDEEGMLRYLAKSLVEPGYQVKTFSSPLALLQELATTEEEGGVLLLDIRMPELDGLELLARLNREHPELGVVMMTGYGTIDSAVEAIKLGAFDYLTKPFPEERLTAVLARCFERQGLLAENRALKSELRQKLAPERVVFKSPLFGEVFELAQRVGGSDLNVLLLGESGTGKELVAAAIHYAGPRSERRFLALNCAALTETLLESQLFGHRKGSFTGANENRKGLLAEADGGTLLLDEVGELSPALQAKLLRVVQEGEFIPVGATKQQKVDVRFIAATNKDLAAMVAVGSFREDLYYRLNVFSLQLPSLRERPEDIEPLARHFLQRAAIRSGHRVRELAPEALVALGRYDWPGNVRELQNVIERGLVLARGSKLNAADLPLHLTRPTNGEEGGGGEPVTLADAERLQVARTLSRTGWNKSRAARLLDITRSTLDRKISDYNLSPEQT